MSAFDNVFVFHLVIEGNETVVQNEDDVDLVKYCCHWLSLMFGI
jgi:hypothetical protein